MNLRIDKEKLKNLCQKNDILLIILHGSYAKGNVRDKSDIDIGILSRKKFDSSKQLNILSELGEVFGDRFDPVFLNDAEPLISYRIAIHGKPLFEDEESIFQRFRIQAIARYMDSKKFRILEKSYLKRAIGKAEVMIDSDLVRRKLSRLNMYLDKLKPIANHTFNEYLSDFYMKTSAERLIQLIVERASNINSHVVIESRERPPEDYTSSFIRASDAGLITHELANKLKGSGGMRNIIVHDYLDIDDKKIYEILPIAISDYKEYIRQVDDFLDRMEKES